MNKTMEQRIVRNVIEIIANRLTPTAKEIHRALIKALRKLPAPLIEDQNKERGIVALTVYYLYPIQLRDRKWYEAANNFYHGDVATAVKQLALLNKETIDD